MQNKKAPRLPMSASGEKSFTLGRYMKEMAAFYAFVVIVFVAIEVVAIRGKIASGDFEPMNASNLNIVGHAVWVVSLLAFFLGCGYALFLLANTTFSSWGIRRPPWVGAPLAVPWSAVTLVTPDPLGLKFHTKGKILIYPFRILDSFPAEFLDLLSQHVPESALAGLYARE